MAAKPRGRKSKKAANTLLQQLIDAVNFVAKAQISGEGLRYTHTYLHNKYAIASDGITSSGMPTGEVLTGAVHTEMLKAALPYCKDLSSMHISADTLYVSSDDYTASIPYYTIDDINEVEAPNFPNFAINDKLISAIHAVSSLVGDNRATVIQSSVHIKSRFVEATDNKCAVQIFHDIALNETTSLLVPKAFANIINCGKQPTAIGFDGESVTIHYSDNSWYKTRKYATQYINIDTLFPTVSCTYVDLPSDFASALKKLAPFAEDDEIYIADNIISTSDEPHKGATVTINSVLPAIGTSLKHLKFMLKLGINSIGVVNSHCPLLIGYGTFETMPVRMVVAGICDD